MTQLTSPFTASALMSILVPDQMIEDLLVTALEGGSNDWYWLSNETRDQIEKVTDKGQPLSIRFYQAIKKGESLIIHDAENEDEILGHINSDSIQNALFMMATDHRDHFMDIVTENYDATTSDVFFQLAVMGTLTFG
jgi:hypothetical protein